MKGWYFQSHRHSLAAKGIKTNLSGGLNFAAKEGFLFGSMRRGSEKALKELDTKYKVTEPAFKEASVKALTLTPGEELERQRLARLPLSRQWSPTQAYEKLLRSQQRQQNIALKREIAGLRGEIEKGYDPAYIEKIKEEYEEAKRQEAMKQGWNLTPEQVREDEAKRAEAKEKYDELMKSVKYKGNLPEKAEYEEEGNEANYTFTEEEPVDEVAA